MPYMMQRDNGKYKVYEKGPDDKPMGDSMGTHDSSEEAMAQMAALHANEDKEMIQDRLRAKMADSLSKANETKEADHTKCGYYDDGYSYVPWGITTFDDLEAAESMQESAMEVKKMTSAFSQLASNILGADITDKAQALGRLASDYTSRIGSLLNISRRKENPSPSLPIPGDTAIVSQESGLYIWKEQDSYRWIAAYSNNYRDEDNPPEIISSASHKQFDKDLAEGKYPMPELWPWHVPYRGGVATLHFYDETTGFTVAAGTFDKDKEWMAEGMMQAGWDGVSHGMPSEYIQKDTATDVITQHVTAEISPLPKWAAANKLTFNVISKENNMGIPAHKLPEFVKAFGEEKTQMINDALDGKAKEAQEAGLEQKEVEVPVQESAPTEAPLTPQQVADAIIMAVTPLAEAVRGLAAEVKELKKSDADKIKEQANNMPAASLESLLSQQLPGLFSSQTEVDGRSSLAKSKPKEAPANKGGLFFDQWIQQ